MQRTATIRTEDAGWSGWLLQFAVALALLGGAVAAGLAIVDPYDTGRPLAPLPGTTLDSPRFAHAGRARQPQFQAAILGNSHVQLLSPARLGEATGLRFVSLTVPGSGVREKLALMRWFLAHRRETPAALVIGIDEFECTPGSAVVQNNPFPFWLYERRTVEYLAGLYRLESLGDTFAKLVAAARGRLRAPGDGYWDYEAGRQWKDPLLPEASPPEPAPTGPVPPLPGLAMLLSGLAEVPSSTALVFVLPPVHASQRPRGDAAAGERGCRIALAEFASRRARTHLVDFRTEDPQWRRGDLFWDATHYRREVAEAIERSVAAPLRAMRAD